MKFLTIITAFTLTFASTTLSATEFYFIRHGQSESNANRAAVGGEHPWVELTEKGKDQARALGAHLKGTEFDAYYTSDTVRTMQTLRYFCEGQDVKHLRFTRDHRVTEKSHGDWEGKLKKEVFTPEVLALKTKWDFKSGDKIKGDSAKEVTKRMTNWVKETAKKHPNERIIVFSHGYAIRCLATSALNLNWEAHQATTVGNTSVTVINSDGDQISCSKAYDSSHLN